MYIAYSKQATITATATIYVCQTQTYLANLDYKYVIEIKMFVDIFEHSLLILCMY